MDMQSPNASSAAIDLFAEAAQDYCRFIDRNAPASDADLLKVAGLLARLHALVLDLPDVSEDAPDIEQDSSQQRTVVLEHLEALPVDYYWDVKDPFEVEPPEPVTSLLSDDLADIYVDLQRGLSLYAAGKPLAATWEWRFHFWAHWSYHLIGAQRAILFMLARKPEQ